MTSSWNWKCTHGNLTNLLFDKQGEPPVCSKCHARLTRAECGKWLSSLWEFTSKGDMLDYIPEDAKIETLRRLALHHRDQKSFYDGYFRGRIAGRKWEVVWSDDRGIPAKEVPFLKAFLRSAVPHVDASIKFATRISRKSHGNPSDLALVQDEPFFRIEISSDRIHEEEDLYYALRMTWDKAVFLDRFVRDRLEPYPFLAQIR